jgi:hypothetical protein
MTIAHALLLLLVLVGVLVLALAADIGAAIAWLRSRWR